MNRYYVIKDEIYQIINHECFGKYRKNGFEHLYNVANTSIFLAKVNKLDLELAGIIGLLHDLATYKFSSSFDHANRSSVLARDILNKTALFNELEILLITTAIKNHSNKDKVDDEYSELIKNADLLVEYLNEPEASFSKEKQLRLDNLFTTLNIPK